MNGKVRRQFGTAGEGSGLAQTEHFYKEELQLAFRNRGMPLEALRHAITPSGMHYLLVHYDVPDVEVGEWTLHVGGLVDTPLSLTLEEIKQRPAQTIAVTMECAGNGRALLSPRHIGQPWILGAVGTAEWTGISLQEVLEETGVRSEATEILFTALDQGVEGGEVQYYQRSLPVEEAVKEGVLLAYEMNGEALPAQHGYPLRLIVPGWYGMASVKWLASMEAIADPFEGPQMMDSYRYAQSLDELGEPVTHIKVRALMMPPGIPDFLTRARLLAAGRVTLSGKAWAGRSKVSTVDVSVDGGLTWSPAQLEPPVSAYAWRGWAFDWNAAPGTYTLCARASDSQGNVQPLDPQWNVGGYGNNMVQRVQVLVE